MLVHIIDVSPYSGRNPVEDFGIVMDELASYNPDLAERPLILVANKIDLLAQRKGLESVKRLAARRRIPFFAVSALKGNGLKPLIAAIAEALAGLEKKND